MQCQTEVPHLASSRDIIIRDGAWIKHPNAEQCCESAETHTLTLSLSWILSFITKKQALKSAGCSKLGLRDNTKFGIYPCSPRPKVSKALKHVAGTLWDFGSGTCKKAAWSWAFQNQNRDRPQFLGPSKWAQVTNSSTPSLTLRKNNLRSTSISD